jgi:hypothetical protein
MMPNKSFARILHIFLCAVLIVASSFGANLNKRTSMRSFSFDRSTKPIVIFLSAIPYPRVLESDIGITIFLANTLQAPLKARVMGDLPIIKIGLGD